MDRSNGIRIMRALASQRLKSAGSKLNEEQLNQLSENFLDSLITFEIPSIEDNDESITGIIFVDTSGTPRAVSFKISNLIINWRCLMVDIGMTILQSLLYAWDKSTLILLAFEFSSMLYSHSKIELTHDHALIYQALWNQRGDNFIINAATVTVLVKKFFSELGQHTPTPERLEQIIEDLRRLRSIIRLPNGDLRLLERLYVNVYSLPSLER